jgi:hypothetical protein
MALTHVTAIRNALADLVVDAIDAGTADAAGDTQIGTAGFAAILAEIDFANPAFGAAAGGTATALGVPLEDSNAAGGGTASVFRCRDRDNAEVFQGVVTGTGGGGDMELSSTTINPGDAVRINSFTYTSSP